MTTTINGPTVVAVPNLIDGALSRLHAEQHRAGRLLAGTPKCQRLSALYEHEARLWTLLVQHTSQPVYRRAVMEAQCAARARAREYAELARGLTDHGQPVASSASGGAR